MREESYRSPQTRAYTPRLSYTTSKDFISVSNIGISSKSTRLVHGGVRYLKNFKPFWKCTATKKPCMSGGYSYKTAPYLSSIILPIYMYWQVPYYWVGWQKELGTFICHGQEERFGESFPMMNIIGRSQRRNSLLQWYLLLCLMS